MQLPYSVPWGHELARTALPVAIISLTLLLYILYGVIWRLYLSPIARFPGPRLAALTFWNETYYDIALGGKYTWKIAEYHKKYGPIVRIKPSELHINDPDFHESLFIGPGKGKTNKWDWTMRAFGVIGTSIFTTLDHDLHRIRRAPWSPYFSKQSIRHVHSSLIQPLVDKLCERFAEHEMRENPVVMVYAWASLTADIISAYSFPQGYSLLSKPDFDAEHYNAWMAFSATVHPCRHFPWVFTIMDALPLSVLKIISPIFYMSLKERQHLLEEATLMRDQRHGTSGGKEVASRPSLLQALTHTDLLPEVEKSPERITGEAQLAMVAGTLTTSHCLKAATYHILANSEVHKNLMQQLLDAIPDPESSPTLDQLEKIPYLMAVMYESLRIFYGISHRLSRVFPDRPMYYKSWTIPEQTPVSMSIPLIHDNEDIFPEPYTFKPDRWLPLQTTGQRLMPYLASFGGGSRGCVGQELGKAEILTALACVFRRFGDRMRLLDTVRERDVDTVYDIFNPAPSKQSNGVLVVFGSAGQKNEEG